MVLSQNTIWFERFPFGLFANACFQIIYAEYLKNNGFQVFFGGDRLRQKGKLILDLFNLPINDSLKSSGQVMFLGEGKDRAQGPSHSINLINQHFKKNPGSILSIEGYFQFDTASIRSDPNYNKAFNQNFALGQEINNKFQGILNKYNNKIRAAHEYLITIHVRRGDYVRYSTLKDWQHKVFYILDLEVALAKLQEYLSVNRISKYSIYVATDDLDFCKNFFLKNNINILTCEDFIDDEVCDNLLVDLAAMTAANMLIASNSSMSLLGAMINNRGRVFWRQNLEGSFVSYDPWSTPILLGPVFGSNELI